VTSFLIFLGVIAAIVFWAIGIYNRLINERNRVRNAFAQIDVQLTRRHDLIPNLVEAVKGYIKHERETLEAVVQARNSAVSSLDAAKADPANAEAIKKLGAAEGVASTENKVAFSRQAFNDAVLSYNNTAENFPNNMIANTFSFELASFLEIETEEKREVPDVSFT
jgi:LemA protein